jgi:hypothetical protein
LGFIDSDPKSAGRMFPAGADPRDCHTLQGAKNLARQPMDSAFCAGGVAGLFTLVSGNVGAAGKAPDDFNAVIFVHSNLQSFL